jgi:alkylated DNA nucleotide flippase Atl1
MSNIDEMRGSSKTLRILIRELKKLKRGQALPRTRGLRGEVYDLFDSILERETLKHYELSAQRVIRAKKRGSKSIRVRLLSSKSRNKPTASLKLN